MVLKAAVIEIWRKDFGNIISTTDKVVTLHSPFLRSIFINLVVRIGLSVPETLDGGPLNDKQKADIVQAMQEVVNDFEKIIKEFEQ